MNTRSRNFRIWALAIVFVGVISFISCSSSKSPTSPNNQPATHSNRYHAVNIQNMAFNPASLSILAGDTVVWTNNDAMPHTVTSNSGTELQSAQLSQGQFFQHIFPTAGTYAYHCMVHPSMTGSVTVQ